MTCLDIGRDVYEIWTQFLVEHLDNTDYPICITNDKLPFCPINSTSVKTTVPVPDNLECFCATGYGWINNQCTQCPSGSTNDDNGVATNVLGCYCDHTQNFNTWNSTTSTCTTSGNEVSTK